MNGLQSTVLALIAVLLTLVLVEEAVTTVAVIARTTGISSSVLRTAPTTFLSGVHFICSLESEVRSRKSEIGGRMSDDRKSTI